MRKTIVIDYGFGNLFSLTKALAFLGANYSVSDNPEEVEKAEAIILPGVGAFGDGIAELNKRGLNEAVIEGAKRGIPLLGICLGMQFLFEKSHEFGEHKGLGLIKGEVKRITLTEKPFFKIPHTGWSPLLPPDGTEGFNNPLFSGIKPGSEAYFVHSYAGKSQTDDIIANTIYCETKILAAVGKGNVFGTQFHPEKSGEIGIQILNNFLSL
ncbi:MAG: imidazole glycerol phosphate synthase, glutamine amidotransferase subunit [Candidatus Taylorbacteria bacterium RIFCSPLOWO2_12_FULL_43_20]|uniref:Imidazole glycerol phosphate synthase subunit HisH n=1 Tax=Candidatus Taylorbacteria bacterium RIFCSPLOWO2_12_FULL_43_20 TaxID=1802332 RepID=A0A1G2P2M9_9BACT|nr:MAG: imidazole glycerol phosphate synthase, glutamine amidotransferase subunit [Candidatus Taylorbacteria bacterium RIFCSPHIGHO2_01_FULL_43_120]OHA22421.1 MAG: imidazole glycerol phosphate synthase, glutamine amidotransferase subunit [Candidatus Taylorbacteria bacterium RIFCSPHIGHO2_02_FULL_43_55]OHA28360.1 MAG: imidazole glycerol phosphate synthase, glutamine amidotransferase subunit [Candidatus Taylorbacteria bacterium RIFCSPHIGHO2_12_FULL_42_34]OHA30634.1 MAG: imidazole glycerol phosphate 